MFFKNCLTVYVANYRDSGTVIAVGDMNSRTGVSDDFIRNDRLGDFTARNLLNMFEYIPDSIFMPRSSEDIVVNQFGRQLC